jgi:hypothetical protein
MMSLFSREPKSRCSGLPSPCWPHFWSPVLRIADRVFFPPWYAVGMEENPYKAPSEFGRLLPTGDAHSVKRRARVILPVGCLVIVAIWLLSIAEMLATGENLLPHWGFRNAILLYAANMLSWIATALALWKDKTRTAILAVICDFGLFAMMFVGFVA